MPRRSGQQVNRRVWTCRLVAFALCICTSSAIAQQKDRVLDAWDSQYAASGRAVAVRSQLLNEIGKFLDAHASDPAAYRTCALGYNHLDDNERAVTVMRAFLQQFPQDTSDDSLLLFFFGNYGTTQDIVSVPPHVRGAPGYWDWTLEVLERDGAPPAHLKKAGMEAIRRVARDQDRGGEERIKVAEIWLRTGVDPPAAEQAAREAVSIAEIGPPPDIAPTDQRTRVIFDRLGVRSVNRSTLGWALFKEQRYPEARTELERAAQLAQSSSFGTRDVFFRLGQALEKLGQPEQALLAYDEEMAWGNSNATVEARRAAVYRELHGSIQGLDTDELNRVNTLAMQRSKNDTALLSDLDQDLGHFSLLDEHGKALDLKQYRGKLVLVDFWATWCGECLLTMRQANALQEHYPERLVVVAPNQDAELTRPKARQYLDKMGYRFVLVYDDDKRRQIRLPFIPAELLLDEKGRLRFMELGATPEGGLLLENKINQLLQGSHTLLLKNDSD